MEVGDAMFESKFYKKNKRTNRNNEKTFPFDLKKLFSKILITIIITLLLLIGFKIDINFKKKFNQYVYNTSFPFAKVKEFYKSYFGEDIISKKIDNSVEVFSEKLTYSKKNMYKDGVALSVTDSYMVPSINSGIVVFIGQKDHYENTVIIQQMDGIDTWYGNIDTANVKLYDYVEKGSLIGQVKGKELYLVFQKDGKFLDYKDYVK